MKYHLIISLLLLSLSLFSQQKGVSPLEGGKEGENGQTYAIVVGISDYQDEGIPDLRFADRDAEAFANFLRSPAGGGLDEDHLKVLINEKATAAQFAIALDWLWEVAKENERVIIYFSGHGDVERKSITQPGFLLCWDAPPRVYMSGGTLALPLFQEVISTLSLINKSQVIVITDACRSGKLSGSEINGNQLTNAHLRQRFANEVKILSCQPDEYSIEGEQWGGGRGVFSFHLLDGLYGLADSDADQSVSLKEIGRYLEDHVTEEAAPQRQNPLIVGDKTGKLTAVFPEILAQLKEGNTAHLQMFKGTEARGMEQDVLASADTSIVEMYVAFKQSLTDKKFLEPASACADYYFEQLINEPKLEPLHSNMRRNYAAALQDDAQQVLNKWQKVDPEELSLTKVRQTAKYQSYPKLLERAIELLGEDHYMYPILQARKLYFEGYLMHIDHYWLDRELGERIMAKYRESLRWLPESPQVYFSMMNVQFHQLSNPDSAEYYAHLATQLAPTWVMPYFGMASLYANSDDLMERKKGQHFLEMAFQIDTVAATTNPIHMLNWSFFYRLTGQTEAAINQLNKILAVDSTYAPAYIELGNVSSNQMHFGEAEMYYKKAISIDPTIHTTINNLGLVYFRTNRFAEAEAQYQKYLEVDPISLAGKVNLAMVYIATGRYEEADSMYQKSVETDPLEMRIYSSIGGAYNSVGQWEKAEKIFDEGLRYDSTQYLPLVNLGFNYFRSGRYEEAERNFEKILKIDSTITGVSVFMAAVYIATGREQEGKALFDKVLQADPMNVSAYEIMGTCYTTIGNYEEAAKMYRKVVQLDPKNLRAKSQLGWLYLKTKQLELAEQQYSELLQMDSSYLKSYIGHHRLALLYARMGRLEEAEQQLDLSDPVSNNGVWLVGAEVYCWLNQVEKAYQYFEKALESGYQLSVKTNYLVNIDEDLDLLKAQKERWEALLKKYFPDQYKD